MECVLRSGETHDRADIETGLRSGHDKADATARPAFASGRGYAGIQIMLRVRPKSTWRRATRSVITTEDTL
jgi:hypothetical protein